MTSVAASMGLLDAHARELDKLSKALTDVERKLEPVEDEYRSFVDSFEIGLWTRHVDQEAKLPSEAMRLKLAHAAMPPELLGRYTGLIKSRKRIEQRIRDIKAIVEAQRSILSALKVEMEASGAS